MCGIGAGFLIQPVLYLQIAVHIKGNGTAAFHVLFFHICKMPPNYIEDIARVLA